MTEFATMSSAADLNSVEEGVLRGLASLGFNPTVADLAEFAAGFAAMTFVTPDEARDALLLFDALGWARPAGDEPPLFARAWFATGQGRAAAEGTFAVTTTTTTKGSAK